MSDNIGTAKVPLHEMLRSFIRNVRAHPGEIESDEHSITTPIDWDGLGHAIHSLATFDEMADALEEAERLRTECNTEMVEVIEERDFATNMITGLAQHAGCTEEWSSAHEHGQCIHDALDALRTVTPEMVEEACKAYRVIKQHEYINATDADEHALKAWMRTALIMALAARGELR
jgi:hypothetical protein